MNIPRQIATEGEISFNDCDDVSQVKHYGPRYENTVDTYGMMQT